MDDLAGLDWTSSGSAANSTTRTNGISTTPSFSYPTLQPTPPLPLSGRSTPSTLSAQLPARQSNASPFSNLASKPSTPANDSFSSLLSSSASSKTKQDAGLSMQERQRQLLAEKTKQEEARRLQFDNHFGASNGAWNNMSSGKSTPNSAIASTISPPPSASGLSAAINKPFAALDHIKPTDTGDSDLLAAFSADAPVDKTSHFPASASHTSHTNTPLQAPFGNGARGTPPVSNIDQFESQNEDDPFGLGAAPKRPQSSHPQPPPATADDDDDILGLLGKPVTRRPEQTSTRASPHPAQEEPDSPKAAPSDPRDKAVAELVDMGFPADRAAEALAQTESGMNVQAAVGILLNQAHEESRQKARGNQQSDRRPSPRVEQPDAERSSRNARGDDAVPAWMRTERSQSGQRRSNNQSPSQDKDVSQYASEFGTSMWKSANSLWKTGQKRVQKAVADFNTDAPADSSQPKWMRDAQVAERQSSASRQAAPKDSMTNEAALLEGGARPQKPRRQQQQQRDQTFAAEPQAHSSRFNELSERPISRPRSPPRSRASPAAAAALPSSRGFKFDDDAATAAYTSSSRRRGPTPKAATPAPQEDLFSHPAASKSNGTAQAPKAAPRPVAARPQPSAPPRPKAPSRQIPSVSPSALASSAQHRQAGSAAFKRGDYAAAHISYSSALTALAAPSHPIAIVILCNRATTNIKVGDPKAAVADADRALEIIGPAQGQDEKVATGDGPGGSSGEKDMKEFYGKALMRKAEALEHMEKWADAAKAWRLAVEVGAGGAVSIQGRNRCEKAAGGSTGGSVNTNGSAPVVRNNVVAPPRKVAPSKPAVPVSRPPVSSVKSAEAVKKLRAQHAADSAAEDEKFALADSVDAKLVAWKGSKADNLRALLGSMDKVLWPEAGWNKVGMQDLVMPNRVKIVYMKAIAKVHPDKISQDATTEQRMISAAVFSTLNEAWDKFKTENGL